MQEVWLGLKTKRRKRTEKVFEDYNDYRDRPFGLKWGTAFAIDELNKVITDNKEDENRIVEVLPQMSRVEIDEVLQLAFLKSKKVSVQLNERDSNGKLYDNIVEYFKGFTDFEGLYIGDVYIEWDLIRNIRVLD